MEHKSEPVPGLIATVRSGIRLRDGYYLNEELVDLYLVGVLRGAAIGLMDAEGPYGQDADRRELRLRELNEVSIELLDHLDRLRPEPVRTPTPSRCRAPRRPDPGPSRCPTPCPTPSRCPRSTFRPRPVLTTTDTTAGILI